ncbi:uncharacterized protein LOC129574311 [Sitodiplosis mosellana]|uniref:uncharacterized protein LOC129574311 n=1 Tax=Sitodiplosis mosellana TaxID=263140 RepID=UPI002444E36F|nr:uncharacterized protein LOC129574311 [Sitodiplosis mosellana]
MPLPSIKSIEYRHLSTLPAILRIVALIFNILAIIFASVAENPYYDVKNVIKFNSIAIAGASFSFITLALVVCCAELRDSLKWLRNELLIQCALIIVFVYGCVTMVREILECYHTLDNGCPRQLTATISGIAATITYVVDAVFKLREWRRKSRAERLAATEGVTKVEAPYVDNLPQSITVETVAETEDEDAPPPVPKSSPPAE